MRLRWPNTKSPCPVVDIFFVHSSDFYRRASSRFRLRCPWLRQRPDEGMAWLDWELAGTACIGLGRLTRWPISSPSAPWSRRRSASAPPTNTPIRPLVLVAAVSARPSVWA